MSERIVVIGGVAAGMSAAVQAKRRRPEAEVVVLERGPHVSYAACGMPYNIADPARPIDDLVVVRAEAIRRERGIDLRTRHEVTSLDLERKRVRVRDLSSVREHDLGWDALVIATGASAVKLPIPGIDLPGVFPLRELTDGDAMKRFIAEKRPARAAIIGAGYIGMEMAESLLLRGLEVAVLEKLDQVVPGFDPAIAELVEAELAANGIRVETGICLRAIEPADGAFTVTSDRGPIAADLVLVSAGIRPNVSLARSAGILLGATGAIAVDASMRTSARDVYAAGDCAETMHRVLDRPAWIPLGTTANKQGKIAGANAAGGDERFAGVVGTAVFKVLGLEVGRTGLGSVEIEREGLRAVRAVSTHQSRGHAYPGAKPITTVLFAEKESGRLLGAQMIGGESVAKRIDVLATALSARMTIEGVESLDLAYAPPFAPVYDPILVAASVAKKQLSKGGV